MWLTSVGSSLPCHGKVLPFRWMYRYSIGGCICPQVVGYIADQQCFQLLEYLNKKRKSLLEVRHWLFQASVQWFCLPWKLKETLSFRVWGLWIPSAICGKRVHFQRVTEIQGRLSHSFTMGVSTSFLLCDERVFGLAFFFFLFFNVYVKWEKKNEVVLRLFFFDLILENMVMLQFLWSANTCNILKGSKVFFCSYIFLIFCLA